MKKEEKLLRKCSMILCACLLLSALVFGLEFYIRNKEARKPTNQINIENSVVIIANDDAVVAFHAPLDLPELYKPSYAEMIVEAAKESWGLISLEYAEWLVEEIKAAALRNGLTVIEGFTIVHIESDFRPDAYNRIGDAVGLTQITPPCLAEYNNMHGTNYSMKDMKNPSLNLEVGFWYYNRILTHYDNCYGYITRTTEKTKIRDAYIAYNVGVTMFHSVGRWGRNQLRQGIYPVNMYGSKAGDSYDPVTRCFQKMDVWM